MFCAKCGAEILSDAVGNYLQNCASPPFPTDRYDPFPQQDDGQRRFASNPSSPVRSRQSSPPRFNTTGASQQRPRSASTKRASKENVAPVRGLYPSVIKKGSSKEYLARTVDSEETASFKHQIRMLQEDLARRVEEEARVQQMNQQLRERLELFQAQNDDNVERAERELSALMQVWQISILIHPRVHI